MTLADVWLGHVTTWQVLKELAPLVAVGVSAFFAGYEHGLHQGYKRWLHWIDKVSVSPSETP